MYFGSVKFFKHLIYIVFFGWLAIATVLAIVFGVMYNINVKEEESKSVAAEASKDGMLNIPKNSSAEEVYSILRANGYSADDFVKSIEDIDPEVLEKLYVKDITSDSTTETAATTKNETTPEENTSAPDNTVTSLIPENGKEYETLYPDLYANAPNEALESKNTIYLTFDDGPSVNTPDILNILDKYNIKATFFMCGGNDKKAQSLMKMVAEKGHTIGIHSISHDYEKIYSSVDSFLNDMNNTYMSVYNATGVKPQIMRFAGGSVNDFNTDIYKELTDEVTRRGFTFYDWNVSGEDASTDATWTSIYNNVLTGVKELPNGRAIVLLHDSADKYTTVTTVEDIITALLKKGYKFAPLDNNVKPVQFPFNQN